MLPAIILPSSFYSDHIHQSLQPRYEKQRSTQVRLLHEVDQFSHLEKTLELIEKRSSRKEPLVSLVHLGRGFHVKGVAEKLDYINIMVGLGYHAEFSVDEAKVFIEEKKAHLQILLENISQQITLTEIELDKMAGLQVEALLLEQQHSP
mmetsp:Transcript_525/g.909  ORF Transcript_525/g.909 Transcript_525/m.909 type:complete len:149 (-) Transcript_525:117-563(-)